MAKKRIDWTSVRRWLEAGHTLDEICEYFELGKCMLRRRAVQELPMDVRDELSRLARRNARWAHKGGKPLCGTMRGYYSHKAAGEMQCVACCQKAADYRRERERKKGRRTIQEAAKERFDREGFPWKEKDGQGRTSTEPTQSGGTDDQEAEQVSSLGG